MSKQISDKVVYPELSYSINGVLFDVASVIGYKPQEKYYQKAVAIGFRNKGLNFREQVVCPLKYQNEKIGWYKLDFVIENRIVLELKVGERMKRDHYEQVKGYLGHSGLQLGLLALFNKGGVDIRRVVNLINK